MRRLAVAAVLLTLTACASTDGPEPAAPVQVAPDPRIAEMQTSMTELLERMDVMSARIARLEEAASATAPESTSVQSAPAAASAPAPRSTAGEPQRAVAGARLADEYRQAISLFGHARYADARKSFQAIFDAEPNGELADNALFWIGETFYATGDYANAIRYYKRVVSEFADQNKAPDALFKTALALERTGDLALARTTLQQVVERYPYSSTANSAKAELQRIKY